MHVVENTHHVRGVRTEHLVGMQESECSVSIVYRKGKRED